MANRTLAMLDSVSWEEMPTKTLDGAAPPPAEGPSAEAPARYERRERLGAGGMGEVWRAHDRALGRDVAMKILRPGLAQDAGAIDRFRREAMATAALEHPGIVPVHEMGILPDGALYFTMRVVEGQTLSQWLAASRPPGSAGLRAAVDLLVRVAEALAFAHSRGAVHRDLKPDNVMVGAFGEVQLMDWGLVKVRASVDRPLHAGSLSGELTQVGAIQGTPAYMAPEQAMGAIEQIGPPTDVYALGVMLYEILTGRLPFTGSNARAVLLAVIQGKAPPLPADADSTLSALVRRAMAPDPADRPAEAGVFAEGLRRWAFGADRRQRALDRVAAADALVAQREALLAEAAAARTGAVAAAAGLAPWASADEKRPAWALEDAVRRLSREAALLEVNRSSLLRSALNEDPTCEEAHDRLADLHQAEHKAAEERGDELAAAQAELLLREHDAGRGRHTAWLVGRGSLTLRTDPPGAVATLWRYVEQDRRLVPVLERVLGETPLERVSVPRGSLLVTIAAPGRSTVRYPVMLDRGEHWHGVGPGERAPRTIALPRVEEVPPGTVYVPAGWTTVGVRGERQENEWPEARVWVEGFFMGIHPVTNAQYIEFLDDLVSRGDEAQALARAPRSGGRCLYGRRDDGGFCTIMDSDGDRWRDDWPVMQVDWHDAAAFSAWKQIREGRIWALPTEREWEKAARGVDRRRFPWGPAADPSFAYCRQSKATIRAPAPIGDFPGDESPYGVRGMGGNVMDWTADHYEPSVTGSEFRACRGGSYTFRPSELRSTTRWTRHPVNLRTDGGFRLVVRST